MFTSTGISSSSGEGEWTNKIYFDPEADKSEGSDYKISDEDLKKKMTDLIEGEENIKIIYAYECPIWGWQWSHNYLAHKFIVLETDKWWWSIEKNAEGITIQRSKKLGYIKDRYRRNLRPKPVDEMKWDIGQRTMKELVEFLYKEDELHKRYNVFSQNCKHFAERIFDEIAKTKHL